MVFGSDLWYSEICHPLKMKLPLSGKCIINIITYTTPLTAKRGGGLLGGPPV